RAGEFLAHVGPGRRASGANLGFPVWGACLPRLAFHAPTPTPTPTGAMAARLAQRRQGLIRASTLKGQFLACQGCRSSPAGDRWGDALPGRVGAMVQAGAASQAATTRLRGARPLAVNFREVVQSVRTGNADVAKP